MIKVYLDINIFNRPFDDQEQERIKQGTAAIFSILQRIKNGDFMLLWFFMLDYENSLNPFEDVRMEIEMASSLAKEIVATGEPILADARGFERNGIKPKDAIHLACAIKGKAGYFITCDDKIIKKAPAMEISFKIMNPVRFVEDMEVK